MIDTRNQDQGPGIDPFGNSGCVLLVVICGYVARISVDTCIWMCNAGMVRVLGIHVDEE